MSKKILFIITQSEFGGAQRALFNIAANINRLTLAEDNYEIIVAAGPEGDNKNGLLAVLEKQGIKTTHLKYLKRAINPLFDFLALTEINKLVKKQKPDIIFLGSSKAGFLGSLATALISKSSIPKPKVIYRIGGWSFNEPIGFYSRAIYKFIEKISAKWKDIIIVNSNYEHRQAIKIGIKPKKKIVTVYNGIDVDKLKFLPPAQAQRELFKKINFQLPSENLIIGTIANFYPAKGLEYLIEAVYLLKSNVPQRLSNGQNKQYQQAKFIIIGEGREREKLEKLIKKYNLEKDFFLAGAIANAYKYLKAFDIFVLPSVKEGFPWTILEAMAAGVSIIATKVGGVGEVIESGKTGLLVKPARPEELARATAELLDNFRLRETFSRQAEKVVKQKFSLDKMVSKIEKLL